MRASAITAPKVKGYRTEGKAWCPLAGVGRSAKRASR